MTDELDREAVLERLEGVKIGESLLPVPQDESKIAGEEQPPENIDAQTDTDPDPSSEETPDAGTEQETQETDSRYEKLRKAEQRQNKAWQKIEGEKADVRKLKEELDAERKALEGDRLQVAESLANTGKAHSPEALEKVAERFRDEGDPELAAEAEKMAKEARESQGNASKTVEVERFKETWRTSIEKETESNPDLKNSDSALYKTVAKLLREKPVLATYETGFTDAVEVAKSFLKGDQLSTLETENKRLKNELSTLKNRTQLKPGDAPRRPKERSFEDLSLEEQKQAVLRQCELADSRR